MTDAEINRKCAALAGMAPCSRCGNGLIREPFIILANGASSYCPQCFGSGHDPAENFTASLDACRKWLWPVIRKDKALTREYVRVLTSDLIAQTGGLALELLAFAPPEAHAKAFIAVMAATQEQPQ